MELDDLLENIDKKRLQELALLDCLASALTVNSIFKEGGIDYSAITPEMEEAFQLQYPNMDIFSLENYDSDQIVGIINGWKGKLFEVNLRDGLNDGLDIGGIKLDYNHTAQLIQDPTNPGFDLQILDDSGVIVEELQAKATNSISYINETIEKYPDFDIITTEEMADSLGSNFDTVTEINGVAIHNSHLTNEELTNEVGEIFNDDSFDIFGLSFLLVPIVRNGRNYLAGRSTVEKAVTTFVQDSSKSIIAIGGGSTLALLGMSTGIGIVASFVIRMAIGNNREWGDLNKYNHIDDKQIWGDLNKYDNIKDSDIW